MSSDSFDEKACQEAQDRVLKLRPYLEGLKDLQGTVMNTAKRVDALDESHNKTLDKIDVVIETMNKLTNKLGEMVIRYDTSREQNQRIEASVNDIAKDLRKRIKSAEDRQAATDIEINTLKVKQGGALTIVKTMAPWLITFGYFIFNQLSK